MTTDLSQYMPTLLTSDDTNHFGVFINSIWSSLIRAGYKQAFLMECSVEYDSTSKLTILVDGIKCYARFIDNRLLDASVSEHNSLKDLQIMYNVWLDALDKAMKAHRNSDERNESPVVHILRHCH